MVVSDQQLPYYWWFYHGFYQWCRREIASENYHFLLRSALFEYLDVSYLAMLSKCSCNVSYSHGKVIKEEGPGSFMYLVKKGMVTPGLEKGWVWGWGTSPNGRKMAILAGKRWERGLYPIFRHQKIGHGLGDSQLGENPLWGLAYLSASCNHVINGEIVFHAKSKPENISILNRE